MQMLLALVLALAAEPAAPPNPAILGQWESAARTEGGIGNILEFYADGRVTQISASMGESGYKLEGEWLRTFWKDPKTGKISEVDTRIEFEGRDRFLEKGDEAGGDTWSERIGDPIPGESPLLGKWCSLFLDTLTTYREFSRDRMFNRMPVVTIRGNYAMTPDTLTVQMQGQPAGQYPYRLEKGLLIIRSRDGSEKQYKRPECSLLKGY